jgi:hypothetical protein
MVVICGLVEGQIGLKIWLTTETLRTLLLGIEATATIAYTWYEESQLSGVISIMAGIIYSLAKSACT